MTDPAGLLELAVATAREAGALLAARVDAPRLAIATKTTPTDMVSEVDHEAEALIVGRILAARPDDGVVGEEGSNHAGTSGVRWVIDPLDGTTNFLYRRADFAVSIAAEVEGRTVAGAVHDASRGITYWAATGSGAFRDGEPIHASAQATIGTALTGTGFAYIAEVRAAQAAVVARLLPRVRDIRRAGSAALDLCAVACGRLDAYYETGLGAWDMAAGRLIVDEAGGVTGFVPVHDALPPALVAAGPQLYTPFAQLLRGE